MCLGLHESINLFAEFTLSLLLNLWSKKSSLGPNPAARHHILFISLNSHTCTINARGALHQKLKLHHKSKKFPLLSQL